MLLTCQEIQCALVACRESGSGTLGLHAEEVAVFDYTAELQNAAHSGCTAAACLGPGSRKIALYQNTEHHTCSIL